MDDIVAAMAEESTLINPTEPMVTSNLPDIDAGENANTNDATGKSNLTNNKYNQLDEISLVQCRKTVSLVDALEKEPDVEQETVKEMDNEIKQAQHNFQEQRNGGKSHPLNHDHALNITDKISVTVNDEIITPGLSTMNVPVTKSTILPMIDYLHSSRLSISTTPFVQPPLFTKDVPQNWDHFLRSGARIKTLLSDAIGEVKNTIVSMQSNTNHKRSRGDDNNPDDSNEEHESPSPNQRSRVVAVADFTVELAREKTAQVMQLQRQLKDAQAQAAAVQAANTSLREETSSGQSRLDRTLEALRIASSNAAKARADADAAEATASTLAQTLQNLQTVLTETKSASQILHQEQQELNATVANVESKLIKKEADLLQAKKEISTLRNSNESLETAQSTFSLERDKFEQKVKQHEKELDDLKHEKSELVTMEKARKDRSDKVEQEWRKAQTMLIESTSGQAAALQTQAALEKTIASLQKANEDAHAALTEHQRVARDDKHRLTESLGKVEKEAQQLRIAAEATDEEMARLKANKASAEKQIQQLKSRLSATERSLKEASAMMTATTTPVSTNVSPDAVSTPIIPNQLSFHLPPLATTGKKSSLLLLSSSSTTTSVPTITEKENIGVQNGELCCVCYKSSIGIMKVCQCGSTLCHKKAHANCIKFMNNPAGPSVSHPGTPAPKLPVVLCDHLLTTTTKLHSIHNSSRDMTM